MRKFPLKEDFNTDKPLSFYAATKKSNEVIAHSFSNIYGLPSTGLRFFTVYGPYGRPDMALYKFSNDIINYDYINYDWDLQSLTLSHGFIGFSLIGYFTEFGNGTFYKLDIGRAFIDYDLAVMGGDDTNISEKGVGFGLGFGYSYYMEALKKTRVFISYNLFIRNIDLTNSTVPILEDFKSYNKQCINFGFIF